MAERCPDNRNTLQTLRRGLQVLEMMAETGPLGVGELSRRLHLSKTVAHRLLKTLEEDGWATRDALTDKSKLTFRMFALGASVAHEMGLQERARPYLERLANEPGETANLGVVDGTFMVYVEKVESPEPFRIGTPIGKRVLPAISTSNGRAILAHLPSDEVREIFDKTSFEAWKPHKTIDFETLQKELDRVRTRGFALDREECAEGILCAGAPILRNGKYPIAAISVVGRALRLRRFRLEDIGCLVRDAAAAISRELDNSGH